MTPRYVASRINVAIDHRLKPDDPWLTRDAIDFLDQWLRPTDIFAEFGSGRSTIWIAQRVRSLLSVEPDPNWHSIISSRLAARHLNNVDYRVKFESYEIASEIENNSLDAALVDGKFRDQVALEMVSKVKLGGIITIDNVNWFLPRDPKPTSPGSRSIADGTASKVWDEFIARTANWRVYWTTNGVNDTAFFFKPADAVD
ncbi:class I SAM-dependent methyltransferase [Mesorhizobium sp. M0923]|uniref:hypothetical protein n=1 Tax=Mesorhizobium sp. M0923 TaxID=2957028 RepID=UPI00333B1B20